MVSVQVVDREDGQREDHQKDTDPHHDEVVVPFVEGLTDPSEIVEVMSIREAAVDHIPRHKRHAEVKDGRAKKENPFLAHEIGQKRDGAADKPVPHELTFGVAVNVLLQLRELFSKRCIIEFE